MVAAGLVVAPWTQRGWLLLLDWTPGPHPSLPRSAWGLDGAIQTAVPFGVAVAAVSKVVGAAALGWLVIAAAVALAFVSAAHLVGGSATRRVAAGALYAVNPILFERAFAGQVAYLLAYALLPCAVSSIVAWRARYSPAAMRPALWLAGLTAVTVHFFWIVGVLLVAQAVAAPPRRRALGWAALVGVLAVAMSAYFVLPSLGRPGPVIVDEADVLAFRTRPDPGLGLAGNVAGLYGFWRGEPDLPKSAVGGWPFVLAAIAVLAGVGLWRAARDASRRPLALTVALAGVAGFVLALGDQGPTGPAFRFAFDNVPGFAVMREPHKFVALVALAYAVGFGFGVEHLVRLARRPWRRLAAGALGIALPVLYTPTLFFGLGGQVEVSQYPASWFVADRQMGPGEGKVLFLPWHQYMGFSFTGRNIANPSEAFFRRDVIRGDNVELPTVRSASRSPRSAYLEYLYDNGPRLCAFGRLVAPLGVEYVVLVQTADAGAYTWLDRQVDLRRVHSAPDLVVYRNLHYAGLATTSDRLLRLADRAEVVRRANAGQLHTDNVVVRRTTSGPVPEAACSAPGGAAAWRGDGVRRTSPTTYRVTGGAARAVAIAEEFDRSWRAGGREGVELVWGTTGIALPPGEANVTFGHWRRVRAGYAASALAVVALALAGTVARSRSPFRRHSVPRGPPPAELRSS